MLFQIEVPLKGLPKSLLLTSLTIIVNNQLSLAFLPWPLEEVLVSSLAPASHSQHIGQRHLSETCLISCLFPSTNVYLKPASVSGLTASE